MEKGTYVFCTTQFEHIHSWPGASGIEIYLKHPHRHMFHVKIVCKVNHDDRDIEFIRLKDLANSSITHLKEVAWKGHESCEMLAKSIHHEMDEYYPSIGPNIVSVEVSEDGENGAIVVCQ